MKIVCSLFLILLLIVACNKDSKNPVDNGDNNSPLANCGPDLTVKVGELAEVDVSGSLPKDRSKITNISWGIDENNPSKIVQYTGNIDDKKHYFGFLVPGTYKIYFTIGTQKAISKPDTLTVTVLPRTNTLIDDVGMELAIRYSKKYSTGELSDTFLSEVDSIVTVSNPLTSLKGIDKCINLRVLDLGLKNIKDISPLAHLTKLEYLDLNQNRILSDIHPLRNLVNLTYLNLYSCLLLKTVEPLSGLISLNYLNLSGDKDMTEFQNLSKLVNLEELYIEQMNQSEKGNVSFLSNMTKLEKLSILDSGISDISYLKNLTALKNLDCSANIISNLTPLKNLTNLEALNIGNNRVSDIEIIRVFKKITSLKLLHNQIEDITPITMLKNLINLELGFNKIYNIKPLIDNESLSVRGRITLYDNPLDSISVHVYIPKLRESGATVIYSE